MVILHTILLHVLMHLLYCQIPSSNLLLSITDKSSSSITLQWSRQTAITNTSPKHQIVILYKKEHEPTFSTIRLNATICASNNLTFTRLQPYTKYLFEVYEEVDAIYGTISKINGTTSQIGKNKKSFVLTYYYFIIISFGVLIFVLCAIVAVCCIKRKRSKKKKSNNLKKVVSIHLLPKLNNDPSFNNVYEKVDDEGYENIKKRHSYTEDSISSFADDKSINQSMYVKIKKKMHVGNVAKPPDNTSGVYVTMHGINNDGEIYNSPKRSPCEIDEPGFYVPAL